MTPWREHLRAVVTRSFSPEALVIEVQWLGDMELMVSWPLGNDPKRPGKRSRMIRLSIEVASIVAYGAAPQDMRLLADLRLKRHLRERFEKFDPNHDTPLGREPPVERWAVDMELFLSHGT